MRGDRASLMAIKRSLDQHTKSEKCAGHAGASSVILTTITSPPRCMLWSRSRHDQGRNSVARRNGCRRKAARGGCRDRRIFRCVRNRSLSHRIAAAGPGRVGWLVERADRRALGASAPQWRASGGVRAREACDMHVSWSSPLLSSRRPVLRRWRPRKLLAGMERFIAFNAACARVLGTGWR